MFNDTTKTPQKLTQFLAAIADPRRKQGRRYNLGQILYILLYGSACGCTCITSCQQKAKSNLEWFSRELRLKRIPDPTTICRAIQKIQTADLTQAVEKFLNSSTGFNLDQALCVDGKTLRGVHGVKVRHILSLFAPKSKRTIAQMGVKKKTNELTTVKKLLFTNRDDIYGKTITGDAIFAQKGICKQIIDYGGNYLFRLKDNQEFLKLEISELLDYDLISTQTINAFEAKHGRRNLAQVEVSHDLEIFHDNLRLAKIMGWSHVKTIGRITTNAKRLKCLDGVASQTAYQDQEKTVTYFISSRCLSAKQAQQLLKSHWGIENHLHRNKDMIFMEDRQTLRSGFSHEIMTFIRSFCIYLLYQIFPSNLAYGFREFNYHPRLVQNYFRKAHLI